MGGFADFFKTSGEPKPIVQTNTSSPAKGGDQLLKMALPLLLKTLGKIPKVGGPAALTADQLQAQEMAKAAALGNVTSVAEGAARANNFLTNPDILDASSNPHLQSWMDASIRPITENFTQSVLPNIRGEAISAGGLGGSRQGIAEGNATGGYLRQVGDTSANIANAGYNTGLGAMISGTQLAPQTAGLQLAPAEIFGAVGQQNQDLRNAQINNNNVNKFMPWMLGSNAMGMASAVPGGSATTTVTGAPTTQQPSMFSSLLGGAASGASMGSMFGPVGTAAGGGLGALLGILGR